MAIEHGKGYTKFQRDVIEAVSKLVGDRGFNYDKCATGHLSLYIEGLDKPIFCAGSPSDRRALANVKSMVRRSLKEAKDENVLKAPSCDIDPVSKEGAKLGKVMRFVIKTFRDNKLELEAAELDAVRISGTPEQIFDTRRDFIITAVAKWLSTVKAGPEYFTSEDADSLEKTLMEHINFSMPTMAHYQQALKDQPIEQAKENEDSGAFLDRMSSGIEALFNADISHTTQPTNDEATSPQVEPEPEPAPEPAPKPKPKPRPKSTTEKENPLTSFLSATPPVQLDTLKHVSDDMLDQLIAACEAAKAERKKEAAITDVIQYMQSKGLTIEQINEFMRMNNDAANR